MPKNAEALKAKPKIAAAEKIVDWRLEKIFDPFLNNDLIINASISAPC